MKKQLLTILCVSMSISSVLVAEQSTIKISFSDSKETVEFEKKYVKDLGTLQHILEDLSEETAQTVIPLKVQKDLFKNVIYPLVKGSSKSRSSSV